MATVLLNLQASLCLRLGSAQAGRPGGEKSIYSLHSGTKRHSRKARCPRLSARRGSGEAKPPRARDRLIGARAVPVGAIDRSRYAPRRAQPALDRQLAEVPADVREPFTSLPAAPARASASALLLAEASFTATVYITKAGFR